MKWKFIASLLVAVPQLHCGAMTSTDVVEISPPTPTLGELASKLDNFMIGAAIEYNALTSDASYKSLISDFSVATPMNALKMKATEPAQNSFDFSTGDELVELFQVSFFTNYAPLAAI